MDWLAGSAMGVVVASTKEQPTRVEAKVVDWLQRHTDFGSMAKVAIFTTNLVTIVILGVAVR